MYTLRIYLIGQENENEHIKKYIQNDTLLSGMLLPYDHSERGVYF